MQKYMLWHVMVLRSRIKLKHAINNNNVLVHPFNISVSSLYDYCLSHTLYCIDNYIMQ